jgi:hypothetical protein
MPAVREAERPEANDPVALQIKVGGPGGRGRGGGRRDAQAKPDVEAMEQTAPAESARVVLEV